MGKKPRHLHDPRYAKPGTPPPTPEQVDRMLADVSEAVLALREAQYEVRIAAAERDMARARAAAARVRIDTLQCQLDKQRGGQ